MKNQDLVADYIRRATIRLKAVETLFQEGGWADVVRESQELVELVLKAVLRASNIDPPRAHDVSEILNSESERLPEIFRKNLKEVTKISRTLRKDRELAFYGTEDLTPSEFYKKEDAEEALGWAKFIVNLVLQAKLT